MTTTCGVGAYHDVGNRNVTWSSSVGLCKWGHCFHGAAAVGFGRCCRCGTTVEVA